MEAVYTLLVQVGRADGDGLPDDAILSLEQALEHIAEDECVEVTPSFVRLRKVDLDQTVRARAAKKAKTAAES